ncbi:MAG: amino acid permease [Candidatus Calescibacterium sp.]|nr:amino acid permease [Candidatus Calescibacterium sp.]MCX7971797.1 amino acid permease [bacterium]MDW8194910.1 amino acid permease [Candidatus Calescibacterium sp.]
MRYKLNLIDSILVVVGSMIGSGIFIIPSIIASKIPDSTTIISIWIIAGIITILGAINYAELASMFPGKGGQYTYLRETYGNLIGFLFVWTSFFVIQAGTIAAVAIAMAKYVGTFIPAISEKNIILDLNILKVNSAQLVGALSIILLTGINIIGLKWGSIVQNIFTLSKVIVIFILVSFAFFHPLGSIENLFSTHKVEPLESINLVLMVAAWSLSKVFFAYDAWYYLTYISHEVKDSHKNVPLAMVIGTALTTLIYVVTTMSYFYILGIENVSKSFDNKVAEEVAKVIFPMFGVYFISLGIIISTFGCNNGLILTGARLIYALASDKLFFDSFAKEHPKYQTPHIALIFQAIWIIVLIIIGNYSSLLTYVTFASIGFNFLTVLAVIVQRIRSPSHERPFKAWLYPFSTILYLLSTFIFLMYTLISSPKETLAGIAIILSGLIGYIGLVFTKWRI